MREFELVIDEALKAGLSPKLTTPSNSQLLYECLGFRCGKLGLGPYKELTNPLPALFSIEYNWPYPQFLVDETYNILVVRDLINMEDVIYTVSDDHATVTQIAVCDQLTYGSLGTQVELADFGEYAVMVNGVVIVSWDPTLSVWVTTVATATMPLMRTICNFKGQAVGGNVEGVWHDCDDTFYIWSKIGSIDFTPERGNTAGYRRCPYGGVVHNVRRLGDVVAGYSSEGVTFLVPVKEPAVTFGFVEKEDTGIINKGAVNGSLDHQVYVGTDHIIREVTSQGVKELGYQYLMKQLTAGDIIVQYEHSKKNYFFSDGEKTFMLSPQGMTESPQHPSAVWRKGDDAYMLPGSVGAYDPMIAGQPVDMGYRGQKTTFEMETDANDYTDGEVTVDYLDESQAWNTHTYTPLNNQSLGSVIASGNAFRLRLKFGSIDSDFRISYLRARYKMTDLRGIRGVYAPPPRGQ